MSDERPYDSTFDLGGLPGGEVLFDPEGGSQLSVPPATGGTWQPDPAPTPSAAPPPSAQSSTPGPTPAAPSAKSSQPTNIPVPPPSWPQAPNPYARQQPSGGQPTKYTSYGRTRPTPVTKRRRTNPVGVFLAITLIFGGILNHNNNNDSMGSGTSDQGAVIDNGGFGQPSPDEVALGPQMTWDRPAGVPATATVVITVTSDQSPLMIATNGLPELPQSEPSFQRTLTAEEVASGTIVVGAASPGQITCLITADGVQVAHADGAGSLDCVYDWSVLQESP